MTTEKKKAKKSRHGRAIEFKKAQGDFDRPRKKKTNTKIYKYKSKDKRFTDEQASMHMDIKEKLHSQRPKKFKEDKHGRFKGKVYDAPPTTLVKAGITGKQGKVGLPIHGISMSSSKGKLKDFKVTPYSGSVKTGFTGYDTKTPSKGLKKGGRAGYNIGGRANLLEEMGRIDARRHPDAADRAEKRRVIGELNKGYKSGGAVLKGKKVGCQIK